MTGSFARKREFIDKTRAPLLARPVRATILIRPGLITRFGVAIRREIRARIGCHRHFSQPLADEGLEGDESRGSAATAGKAPASACPRLRDRPLFASVEPVVARRVQALIAGKLPGIKSTRGNDLSIGDSLSRNAHE